MARPHKSINSDQVQRLAAIGCTVSEIALVLNCSPDTLQRRFASAINTGRGLLKTSLRRAQLDAAIKGNTKMLIWLGKQMLQQDEAEPPAAPSPFTPALRERAMRELSEWRQQMAQARSQFQAPLMPQPASESPPNGLPSYQHPEDQAD